ncbi:MAG: hypothetical protein RR646_02535 [Erysipelotrichaceae bacterium]
MNKGQKSITNSIQNILMPMEVTGISQADNEGTHLGTYAVDLTGADCGKSNAYAPVDVECVAMDTKNGNAVWWQSIAPVRFANGAIDYAVFMLIHDNDMTGIHIGIKYDQGTQIGTEGTAGYATGNHIHFEVAKGKFSHMYDKNIQGTYHLPNNMAVEEACFIDDTKMLNYNNWAWKYTKDIEIITINDYDVINVGDTFRYTAVYEVNQVLVSTDSIWCHKLTGDGGASLPAKPLIKCDAYGRTTINQVFRVGDYFKFPTDKLTCTGIDKATAAIQFKLNGKLIWGYAEPAHKE